MASKLSYLQKYLQPAKKKKREAKADSKLTEVEDAKVHTGFVESEPEDEKPQVVHNQQEEDSEPRRRRLDAASDSELEPDIESHLPDDSRNDELRPGL